MEYSGVKRPKFYVGLHIPARAYEFDRSMFSVNVLEHRRADFHPRLWILDSGAFTRLQLGRGHMGIEAYAQQIRRWAQCGTLEAAVTQDFMCEPFMLQITDATVVQHQGWTIDRYRRLRSLVESTYLMPVVQGYAVDEYRRHVLAYGDEIAEGDWVGVGSVCKRNAHPRWVEAILEGIHFERPDIRLHGFGLKRTALGNGRVNELLYSCDSMAWSLHARKNRRNGNDPAEAHAYAESLRTMPVQTAMDLSALVT